MLTGVYAAIVFRYEHIGGGWKQILALPVTRRQPMLIPSSPNTHGAFNMLPETLFGIIFGGFVLFMVSSLLYFSKKAI